MPKQRALKDYTSLVGNNLIHKESPLAQFEFTESLAFDQAYEGVPMMNVGRGSNSTNYGDYSRLDVYETHLAHEDIERAQAVAFVEGNTHAASFDRSSSQSLRVADSASLSVTGDLTIEAWANLASLPTVGQNYVIAAKWSTAASRSYLMQIRNNSGVYELEFNFSSNGTTGLGSSVTISPTVDTWVHYAVTSNTFTGTSEFFINGTSVGTGSAAAIFDSIASFSIGADNNGTTNFFDGQIDDVRIWSEARSSTEISDNYRRQLTGAETNLEGYWRLNNSTLDLTANNNDLTNVNGVTFVRPGGFGRSQDGVVLARADTLGLFETFIGFAQRRMLDGHKSSIQVGGTATFMSGLEPASQYYLSDTPGEISTTAGSNVRKVGISGDEKSIVVTNNW